MRNWLPVSFSDLGKMLGRRVVFYLACSALGGLCLAGIELLFTWSLRYVLFSLGFVVDGATQAPGLIGSWMPGVATGTVILIAIGICRGLFNFVPRYCSAAAFIRFTSRLRQVSIYEMLLGGRKNYVSAAEMNLRMMDIIPTSAAYIKGFADSLATAVTSIGILITMFVFSWKAASFSCVAVFIIGYCIFKVRNRVYQISKRAAPEQKLLAAGIQRAARNRLLINILKTNWREFERLTGHSLERMSIMMRARTLSSFIVIIPEVVGVVFLAVLILLDVLYWNIPAFQFLGFLYLLQRFIVYLSQLSSSTTEVSSNAFAIETAAKFFGHLSEPERIRALSPLVKSGRPAVKKAAVSHAEYEKIKCPRIDFENIHFRYSDSLPPVLNGVSFHIEAGTQVGFVGRNGSGKSTSLSLILGLLDPNQGRVLVGGVSPAEFFKQSGAFVGYVGPEPFLFEGTIRENLNYGLRREFSEEEYKRALSESKLLDVILKLPSGLDHHLNENSDELSAGQKQRLVLARAILGRPQLLILDEAFANLDATTESQVLQTIRGYRGQSTVLIVSHQKENLRYADKIIEFEDGGIRNNSHTEISSPTYSSAECPK